MQDDQSYDNAYEDDYLDPNELTPLRILGGIGLGSAGALLGAVIWAVIVVKAGIESGMIALLVGALVGGGVSLGSQRARGPQLQIIAACIALFGYACGKFIISAWIVINIIGDFSLGILTEILIDLPGILLKSLTIWDLLWVGIAAYMATSMLKND